MANKKKVTKKEKLKVEIEVKEITIVEPKISITPKVLKILKVCKGHSVAEIIETSLQVWLDAGYTLVE